MAERRLLKLMATVIVGFFLVQISTLIFGNKMLLENDEEEKFLTFATSSTKKRKVTEDPDGHFNGHPIKYKAYEEGWHSNVHCVGDNFGPNAWMYRSCHFQNFCFDLKNQSWVLFTSPEQWQMEAAMRHVDVTNFETAFGMNTTVSIGGINQKWTEKGYKHMEWFPQLRSTEEIKKEGYYTFLNDAAMVPFHSMAGFNPGHLLWDDFLPLFTLLSMFQLVEKDLVLMRYKPEFWQWASCDRRWNSGMRKPYCKHMMKKFLPLMGLNLDTMTTQENVNMTWTSASNDISGKTKYVCASNGAAGIGMLTDHGHKLHGWMKKDYEYIHNFGRGAMLFNFRNWMMTNINLDPNKSMTKKPSYKIVFSVHSSSTSTRNVHFKEHMKLVKEELGSKYQLEIIPVKLSDMTLEEQISLMSDASIMVTMCGGGAVTGMFLPKGASLISFYNEKEKGGDTRARLDWDLLNNLSYLRVHWLPRPQNFYGKGGPSAADYQAFLSLIDHELDIISHFEEEKGDDS